MNGERTLIEVPFIQNHYFSLFEHTNSVEKFDEIKCCIVFQRHFDHVLRPRSPLPEAV